MDDAVKKALLLARPPRRPSREELFLAESTNKYPFIKQYLPHVKFNPRENAGYAETFGPDEEGAGEFMRPKEFPMGTTGIEVYRPDKFSAQDYAAEFLHVDPRAHRTREQMLKTFTPQQRDIMQHEPDYTYSIETHLSPERAMQNATDAVMRGYVMGQWPKEALDEFKFTDEQRGYLDELKNYTTQEPRADGGLIERKEWSPFRGLKIRPPAEKLSTEPDIRDYQLKRHAYEFEGGEEPTAPHRKITLDAPAFGGKKELGDVPYYYADPINTALNLAYGLKTAPLYSNPYTAPVGRAIDAYETAKKIEDNPEEFSSYTSIPKVFRGATPLGLMGAGAGVLATQKDDQDTLNEEPEERAYGGLLEHALRLTRR